jgi:uncharacterized membrane protein
MTMTQSRPDIPRNNAKWTMFAVMVLLVLGVLYTDERFLIDPKDDEWQHIAPFQFSERLRRGNVKLHRLMGRIYIGAIVIAAPFAIYIGLKWDDNAQSAIEGIAQGGGWLLCAVLAFVFAVKRNIPRHKQWVARSYGFTFVFIMARAPHIISWHWKTDVDFVTYRWFLVFGALIVPDLILEANELFRRRAPRIART